jgi:hypothetical protein
MHKTQQFGRHLLLSSDFEMNLSDGSSIQKKVPEEKYEAL